MAMHESAWRLRALLFLVCAWLAPVCALEVNTAPQADLERLKGVGVALSQRLVEERRKAPFADWHDLIHRVPGMKDRTALRLSDQGLTVQGVGYDARRREAPAK